MLPYQFGCLGPEIHQLIKQKSSVLFIVSFLFFSFHSFFGFEELPPLGSKKS